MTQYRSPSESRDWKIIGIFFRLVYEKFDDSSKSCLPFLSIFLVLIFFRHNFIVLHWMDATSMLWLNWFAACAVYCSVRFSSQSTNKQFILNVWNGLKIQRILKKKKTQYGGLAHKSQTLSRISLSNEEEIFYLLHQKKLNLAKWSFLSTHHSNTKLTMQQSAWSSIVANMRSVYE